MNDSVFGLTAHMFLKTRRGVEPRTYDHLFSHLTPRGGLPMSTFDPVGWVCLRVGGCCWRFFNKLHRCCFCLQAMTIKVSLGRPQGSAGAFGQQASGASAPNPRVCFYALVQDFALSPSTIESLNQLQLLLQVIGCVKPQLSNQK